MDSKRWKGVFLGAAFLCLAGSEASAGWEAGVKTGYDANVNRSVTDADGDTYLRGYVVYERDVRDGAAPAGTLTVLLEGSSYAQYRDLNYGLIAVEPGIDLYRGSLWTLNLSPLLQLKGVSDSDQSAVAFGGRLGVRQQWRPNFATGQYYIYRDSRATEDVYSFTEHALGVYGSYSWTKTMMMEIGYEFADGDSFAAVGGSGNSPSRRGKQYHYSPAFGDVVREKMTRHTIGVRVAADLTPSFFIQLEYTLKNIREDLGSYTAHDGNLGIGYRF